MSYDGYPLQLARMAENASDRKNLAVSAAALTLGVGILIQDDRLRELSEDFWAERPSSFNNTTHHFLTENSPGINLEWWCRSWIVPRLVTVEILAGSPTQSLNYYFSEGWSGKTDHDRVLSVNLNSPRDLVRSDWEAAIQTSDSEGPILGPLYSHSLPRGGGYYEDDDFIQLVNSIQAGLSGASYTRLPYD